MLDISKNSNAEPQQGWWLQDATSHRYAFGVVLHQKSGNWVVERTLIGSPAEKAGIQKGEALKSVDGYSVVPGEGELIELFNLMGTSDSGPHLLALDGNSGKIERSVEKRMLHELLEEDFNNGGHLLGYCVGCRTCRSVTIGATDCSSGCPGNYCTVG